MSKSEAEPGEPIYCIASSKPELPFAFGKIEHLNLLKNGRKIFIPCRSKFLQNWDENLPTDEIGSPKYLVGNFWLHGE